MAIWSIWRICPIFRHTHIATYLKSGKYVKAMNDTIHHPRNLFLFLGVAMCSYKCEEPYTQVSVYTYRYVDRWMMMDG
jgi:hypothetical protein